MKGVIVRLIMDKDFGFIQGEDNQDYFFHSSALKNESFHSPQLKGSSVHFEEIETSKGLRAEEIWVD
jgi:cold shock CspA family protein